MTSFIPSRLPSASSPPRPSQPPPANVRRARTDAARRSGRLRLRTLPTFRIAETPLSETFAPLSTRSMKHLSDESITSFCFDAEPANSAHIEYISEPEDDDYIHGPVWPKGGGASKPAQFRSRPWYVTPRSLANVGSLLVLTVTLIMVFAGIPIVTSVFRLPPGTEGSYGIGGTNGSGQVPYIAGLRSMIDPDTPTGVYSRMSIDGTKKMKLVFSDEFNTNGRSFYTGDDPFWEGVSLNYWGTRDYEWYDPAAITTQDGFLVITLSEMPIHNLNFRSGMLSSWNKMCFTGGYIEIRAILPGAPDIPGLWPAAWTMGNLGRAGFGATTDGLWPYSYDSCDVGTLRNQTYPAYMGGGPEPAETTGVYTHRYGPYLSYLPGQRLSRCTCANFTDHPGPRHPDGSWVGRSAPELDIFEAAAGWAAGQPGHVSMSLQTAPFNAHYDISTAPDAYQLLNPQQAQINAYTGTVYQQAVSGLVLQTPASYEGTASTPNSWGFEYVPGASPDSHITWTQGGQAMWRLNPSAIGPDPRTQIGQRPLPQEPMYVLLNLGISSSFTTVDFTRLRFPAKYRIDYVRIWQPEGEENIGCDPPDFPTSDYINRHKEVYTNPNLTTWDGSLDTGGAGQSRVPNSIIDKC